MAKDDAELVPGFAQYLTHVLEAAGVSSNVHQGAGPLCLGLSGGSDSLALLRLLTDYVRNRGGRVHALCVDHGLQAAGADWAKQAAQWARDHGASAEILRWGGPYPDRGVPKAARLARHRLLAEATRRAGGQALVLAHTRDDQIEGARMRQDGVPLGQLWPLSPSPVWPEGRDVVLIRPLLGVSRLALQALLRAKGLDWITDPANSNPAYHRARTRLILASETQEIRQEAKQKAGQEPQDPAIWPRVLGPQQAGQIPAVFSGFAFKDLGPHAALGLFVLGRAQVMEGGIGFLSLLLSVASGRQDRARGRELVRLRDQIGAGQEAKVTLSGAVIHICPDQVLICREAMRIATAQFTSGSGVFDGRFEVVGPTAPLTLFPLKGRMAALDPKAKDQVLAFPALLRPSLMCVSVGGKVEPILADRPDLGLQFSSLLQKRLERALGIWGSWPNLSPT